MRNLSKVIEEMLPHAGNGTPLEHRLQHIQNTLLYSAPEAMDTYWDDVYTILVEEIGMPKTEEEYAIVSIFSDKSVATLKTIMERMNQHAKSDRTSAEG